MADNNSRINQVQTFTWYKLKRLLNMNLNINLIQTLSRYNPKHYPDTCPNINQIQTLSLSRYIFEQLNIYVFSTLKESRIVNIIYYILAWITRQPGFRGMAFLFTWNLRNFTHQNIFAHHLRMKRNNICAIFRIVPHPTKQLRRIFAQNLFAQFAQKSISRKMIARFAQKSKLRKILSVKN